MFKVNSCITQKVLYNVVKMLRAENNTLSEMQTLQFRSDRFLNWKRQKVSFLYYLERDRGSRRNRVRWKFLLEPRVGKDLAQSENELRNSLMESKEANYTADIIEVFIERKSYCGGAGADKWG